MTRSTPDRLTRLIRASALLEARAHGGPSCGGHDAPMRGAFGAAVVAEGGAVARSLPACQAGDDAASLCAWRFCHSSVHSSVEHLPRTMPLTTPCGLFAPLSRGGVAPAEPPSAPPNPFPTVGLGLLELGPEPRLDCLDALHVTDEQRGVVVHATAAETLDTYSHLWPDSDDRTRQAVDSQLGGTSFVVGDSSGTRGTQ